VTLKFADRVGEILIGSPNGAKAPPLPFRFYISLDASRYSSFRTNQRPCKDKPIWPKLHIFSGVSSNSASTPLQ
jgi:hypothetical protein